MEGAVCCVSESRGLLPFPHASAFLLLSLAFSLSSSFLHLFTIKSALTPANLVAPALAQNQLRCSKSIAYQSRKCIGLSSQLCSVVDPSSARRGSFCGPLGRTRGPLATATGPCPRTAVWQDPNFGVPSLESHPHSSAPLLQRQIPPGSFHFLPSQRLSSHAAPFASVRSQDTYRASCPLQFRP